VEGKSENGCTKRKADYKDHVWSYDFVMDRTEDGRRLEMMPIVDEHTRECLSIEVERSITADDVVATLARLFEGRGEPSYIRSDNGPEFVAEAVKRWLWKPPGWGRCTSSRAARGRTPTRSRSTYASETSC
jgi:transposase InsO family protein